MTTHRLGPHQRAILEQMKSGAELWRDGWGQWTLAGKIVNRERCSALFVYGYLLGDATEDLPQPPRWRQRYTLTERGKGAIL